MMPPSNSTLWLCPCDTSKISLQETTAPLFGSYAPKPVTELPAGLVYGDDFGMRYGIASCKAEVVSPDKDLAVLDYYAADRTFTEFYGLFSLLYRFEHEALLI